MIIVMHMHRFNLLAVTSDDDARLRELNAIAR